MAATKRGMALYHTHGLPCGPNRPPRILVRFFFFRAWAFSASRTIPALTGAGFQMARCNGFLWRSERSGRIHLPRTGQGCRWSALYTCKADLLFTGEHPLYDYAKSSDRNLRSPKPSPPRNGTKQFFAAMKDTQQVHYEQTGHFVGQSNSTANATTST